MIMDGSGRLLVLTKTNGRILSIERNGTHRQFSSLTEPGKALSITRKAGGSILVAQVRERTGKLTFWQVAPGHPPQVMGDRPAPKNEDSVHLVQPAKGNVLLLEDGRLEQQTDKGMFRNIPLPQGLPDSTKILAAAPDGDRIMLLLPTEFIWLNGDRMMRRLPITEMDSHDGAAITPDGSGGAFLTRYGPAIDHYSAQGRDGTVLIGYGGVSGCGTGKVSGITGNARDQNFSRATSLKAGAGQLYFSDPDCHRILAIGIPAREYFS